VHTKLILDNWLLSEVETLLLQGCASGTTPRLIVDPERATDEWGTILSGLLQVESLIRLLVDVVTRDELIVDGRYIDFWGKPESPLHQLTKANVVKADEINTYSPEGRHVQSLTLASLCATERLRTNQSENERTWAAHRKAKHSAHSVIVWGAAGYLTRSHITGVPYSGHPLRKFLIERTLFQNLSPDAGTRTLRWIDAQRTRVFEKIAQDGTGYGFGVVLPPIAIEIVEAAQSAEDLIKIALQMRSEYAPLRKWMGEYQQALESEEPDQILKRDKVFQSVSEHVSRKLGTGVHGSTAVSVSLGWLGTDIPLPIDFIRQRVGVRAIMNKLIFTKQGKGSLQKLLGIFGERSTSLGSDIVTGLLNPMREMHAGDSRRAMIDPPQS
jgi:hypothetical protein